MENTNKPQISKLIADAEGYLSQHYKKEYYDVVAQSCKAEKEAEKSKYEKVKAEIQAEHQAKLSGLNVKMVVPMHITHSTEASTGGNGL